MAAAQRRIEYQSGCRVDWFAWCLVLPGRRFRCAPHVHDREVVRVDSLPIRQPVEKRHGRSRWRKKCRAEMVFLKQFDEVRNSLQVQRPIITQDEGLAVKLGAAVDEWRDADEIKI